MNRGAKQFLYGLLYLAILGIIAGAFYFTFRSTGTCFDSKQNQDETGIDCGGVCISCEIKNLKPLLITQPVIFRNNGKISVMAELINFNSKYGSDEVKYKMDFYDTGGKLVKSISKYDFIYSSGRKYLIESGINDASKIIERTIFTLEENNWKTKDEWRSPMLELENLKTIKQGDIFMVSGSVKNPNNFILSQIMIGAVLKNSFGAEAGASKTEVNNLGQFQEKNFQIFIAPEPFLADKVDLNATSIVVDGRK